VQARGITLTSHVDGGDSAVQSAHEAPFWPHWLLTKPGWQALLASQQPGQFWALQAGGGTLTQVCIWQLSLSATQFWHCCPPEPQSALDVPVMQTLPAQHPGQLPGPHVPCCRQVPPMPPLEAHVSFIPAQLAHCWPLAPQAVWSVPVRHCWPKQQPLQFFGPHAGCTH
jgi:hypothetical protein